MNNVHKELGIWDFFYREVPNVIQIIGLPLIIVSYLFNNMAVISVVFYITVWLVRGYLDSQIKDYGFDKQQLKAASNLIDVVVIATWALWSIHLFINYVGK
ncbi:hypothetical protein A2716_02320 [candidate division WWE3 bacterium RIFCSPHIGHO2_01_FULL_40_23]|uniref:Uncharacterized protein n=1 Tax=candidate division WWE3 bacterium RIFCSPLOWO2_01_FULL_41_18 TaxID=1802625 RepID=A0A1F4VFS9_UNCKA|nr:MAG: hypothetical protein A2716_02320 [candidate division WWE3 bacterium RIFCSPHIGHO2_01_FULL_40_23]OGC55820.1 MAG: hypothetical protein A3A78_02170 [candidate division WWE3 bacterium RIFCSPLOWO2_01_FULL_41_18]